MSLHSWLRSLRSALAEDRGQRHHGRPRSHQAATHRPSVELLEDRVTPSFGPAVSYPVGPDPVAVVTADFNNDGRLDLATANAGNTTLSVLLGDGLGGFGAASQFATGENPWFVAVGDFDGDGNLDLATANQGTETYFLRYVSVLLGNGDGAFRSPVTTDMYSYPFNLYPRPIAPVAADFDTDGKTDLGFVTQFDIISLQVLLSDGQGGFAGPHRYGEGLGEFSDLAVADLDADSKPDVVMGSTAYGDDGNQFGYVTVALNSLHDDFTFYYETGPIASMAIGDFTRDGIPDLVIAGQTLDVWPGLGDGYFGSSISNPPSSVVGVADFNGDGNLDIGSRGSVLLGLGDGTFTEPYAAPTAPMVGDFNGDGLPDVAYVDSNAVWVRLNDGDWDGPPSPLPVALGIDDVTLTEGNAGTVAATFTVTLSATNSEAITVAYATAAGSATASSDYQAASGTLTFAPGEPEKTITVLVNGDRLAESNETFVVNLSSPINAVIADGQGMGTILDDEPLLSITDVTQAEGKKGQTTLFTFTVTLSDAYDRTVSVSYRTVNGTATTGNNDYVAKTGTLTFAPGETTKTITIEVKGDSRKEADETFFVDLFGKSSNSLFAKKRGIGTILNDD